MASLVVRRLQASGYHCMLITTNGLTKKKKPSQHSPLRQPNTGFPFQRPCFSEVEEGKRLEGMRPPVVPYSSLTQLMRT